MLLQVRTTFRRKVLTLLPRLGVDVVDVAPSTVLLSRKRGYRAVEAGRDVHLVSRNLGDKGVHIGKEFTVLMRHAGVELTGLDGIGVAVGRRGYQVKRISRGITLLRSQNAVRQTRAAHAALFSHLLTEHVCEILRRYRVDCVLDVGANKGQYAQMLRGGGYDGQIVSFEPVPELFSELKSSAAGDPKWMVHQLALGRQDGRINMNVVVGGMSSALPPTSYGRSNYRRFEEVMAVEVPVRRLDSVLDSAAPTPAEARLYVKFDTQGYDLEAFAGLGDRVKQVVALQSEVALLKIYEGMPSMCEAVSEYAAAGFDITGMFPVNSEPDTGRVVEFDCVMTRADAL
jgi:FkbM family methyltransferase